MNPRTVLRSVSAFLFLVPSSLLAACSSCNKPDSQPSPAPSASAVVVAESLPRCRGEGQRLALPGDDAVVGDVAIGEGGLLVGLVHAGKALILRAPLDLSSSRTIEIGTALGDDPPPAPRWNGNAALVSYVVAHPTDGGARLRDLRIAALDAERVGATKAVIVQQADESTDFDFAYGANGTGIGTWDEDAPWSDASAADGRGFVKVQVLGSDTRPRVVSPETTDAESPRIIARPGGFWLAWLARRVEEDGHTVEGPGEKRAFRWVEALPLGPNGESAGPVRRVSSEKGRVAAFELARGPTGWGQDKSDDLVVVVQDDAAPSEGAGGRIVRYLLKGGFSDLVDGGIGHALADLLWTDGGAAWLSWTDTAEKAHLTPLGQDLTLAGGSSLEPALDGTRVLSASGDRIYAVVEGPHPELRRFQCSN